MTKYAARQIGRRQAENVFHAIRFAYDNAMALNLHVTINLSELGLKDDEAGDFFRSMRTRVARWWKYQKGKGQPFGAFCDLAVHSHPPEGRRHVHWLLHAPSGARYDIAAIIENRLKKMLSLDCLGNALQIDDVYKAGTLGKYILRGVDPAYADYFNMWTQDEGIIIGRRVSVAKGISRAKRKEAGWKRRRR